MKLQITISLFVLFVTDIVHIQKIHEDLGVDGAAYRDMPEDGLTE